MPLFLCKLAYFLREFQGLREIVDGKDAAQAFDSIELNDLPASDVALKLDDLGIRHGWCVLAARDALHLRQCLHLPVFRLESASREGLLVGSGYRPR